MRDTDWRDEIQKGEREIRKAWDRIERGKLADAVEPLTWAALHAGRADVIAEIEHRAAGLPASASKSIHRLRLAIIDATSALTEKM
ncbi:MAG: hypothetical protein ACRD1X_22130 [Vicinamibacteria bacterium]